MTESKNAPRGLAWPLRRATAPSSRSTKPLAMRPSTAQRSSPAAMSNAVTTEKTSPTTVRALALIPARSSPLPIGRETLRDAGSAGVRRACLARSLSSGAARCRRGRRALRALATVEQTYHAAPPGSRHSSGSHPGRPGSYPASRCLQSPLREPWRPTAASRRPNQRGVAVKTFPTAKIRNVALVGHGGAGKTTLAEALLFAAGRDPPGRAGRGRQHRLRLRPRGGAPPHLGVARARAVRARRPQGQPASTRPGYADFVGDVAAALRAVDLVVCVVSAVEGVEVQTEVAWKMAEERGIPRVIFVNKLDRERASFDAHARPAEGAVRRRRRAARAPDRRGGRVPRRHRPAHRHRDDLRRRRRPTGTQGPVPDEMADEEHSVHDALDRRHRRRPTTTSWSATSPTRRSSTKELAHALATGIDDGDRVPGAVRQRDQAHRHRPARAVHRRGGTGAARRRERRRRRPRSCSRRSSTRTSGASTCSRCCRAR